MSFFFNFSLLVSLAPASMSILHLLLMLFIVSIIYYVNYRHGAPKTVHSRIFDNQQYKLGWESNSLDEAAFSEKTRAKGNGTSIFAIFLLVLFTMSTLMGFVALEEAIPTQINICTGEKLPDWLCPF